MKKSIVNLMLGLTAAVAFSACSSTEDVTAPGAAQGDVTVTVVTGDDLLSRAGIATVPGYDFKCVMQLVSDAGATIGTQASADASTGSASFTIKAADLDAGATKAIFWAGYVPTAGAAAVYNTADLTAVTYAVTEFDAANADLMAASDAFAGALTTLENGARVTLSRPMIQFNFKPTNPEAATGASKLVVKYEAPSTYNVLSGNCDLAAYQTLTYTDNSFDPAAAGNWFTSLIFAPANLTTLDKEIVMTLTGSSTWNLTIPAGKLPMDPNYIVNTTAEITAGGGDQNLDVDVTVNGSFENEPKPAVFAVGAYLDATGKPVSTREEAVAIVFHEGALGEDVAANYPSEFAGKTIKGYAIAINNVSDTPQSFGNANAITFTSTEESGYTNGTQSTPAFVTAAEASDFVKTYKAWVEANPINGAGLVTSWYLPIKSQLSTFYNMLYTCDDTPETEPTGSDEFRAMFSTENIWGTAAPTGNLMVSTSTINAAGKPSGARLLQASGTPTGHFTMKQIDTAKANQKALCRPMITIFE